RAGGQARLGRPDARDGCTEHRPPDGDGADAAAGRAARRQVCVSLACGVDGCKGGWVAVFRDDGGAPSATVYPDFETLIDSLPTDTQVAVDMPIGLPDHVGHGGRGPEALVRKFLGQRQSSVFSIPSRAAVYAEAGPFTSTEEWYDAHRRASAVARQTSEPPRAISIQAFGIFSKIREIDQLLIAERQLRERVIESHPE